MDREHLRRMGGAGLHRANLDDHVRLGGDHEGTIVAQLSHVHPGLQLAAMRTPANVAPVQLLQAALPGLREAA